MRVVINRQDAFVPFVTSHWADFKNSCFSTREKEVRGQTFLTCWSFAERLETRINGDLSPPAD